MSMRLKYQPASEPQEFEGLVAAEEWIDTVAAPLFKSAFLHILVYLVIYDSGEVSLEHLLLSRYPSQRGPTRVWSLDA